MDILTDEDRKKIIWLRELLKKNAPAIYQLFTARKLASKEKYTP